MNNLIYKALGPYVCEYVWVYVHVLLLHFWTDFLQTGTKLFQIFLALI